MQSSRFQSLRSGIKESGNCRVEATVYDFRDSNALSEQDGYNQLFSKNERSMVLRR